jgi:hypothetical protein
LVNNVKEMAAARAAELPLRGENAKPVTQRLVIDIRGQKLDAKTQHELVYRITKATGGLIGPGRIWFIHN